MRRETESGELAAPFDKLIAARPEHAIVRLFLPAAQCDAISAFEAIVFELEQTLWHAREPQAAAIKLQWWSEELARLLAGEARHPLTQALAGARIGSPVHATGRAHEVAPAGTPAHEAASLRALPQQWLVAAMRLLDDTSAVDFTAQRAAVESFYAPLAQLESALLGTGADSAASRALSLLLRELGRMACGQEPHRLAVSLNLLARHQLAREALAQEGVAREALLRDQLAALMQAHETLPKSPDAGLPVRLRARLDRKLIQRAVADAAPSRVLRVAAAGVPLMTAWHAWREARTKAPLPAGEGLG